MLGALIGAAGSVLGGLLGGDSSTKSKEKTKSKTASVSTTKAKLGQLVKQSEKYGFNPLTVLNAGGLGAFSTTTALSKTSSKSKGKNASSSSAPLGAAIAGAAQSIGGAMQQAADQGQQNLSSAFNAVPTATADSKAAEYNLVQAQLPQYRTAGEVPTFPASSTYEAKTPALGNAGGNDGGSLVPTYEKPTVTNPYPASWGIKVAPNSPDGEMYETRYGDFIGGALGLIPFAQDSGYIARQKWDQYAQPVADKMLKGVDDEIKSWDVLPNVLESVTMDDVRRVQGLPPLSLNANAAEAARRRQYMQMNAAGATSW